jgi:murein DD-endopeptidase MepM/ murein hydrolase activator NlpD
LAPNQGRFDNQLMQNSADRLSLGDRAPILSGSGRRPPDRRQVSIRWLSSTFLTGITSSLLMGGALYASLEGRQKAERPTSFINQDATNSGIGKTAEKGDRTVKILATSSSTSSIMDVPTMSRVGDSNVVRKRPFAHVSAPLAIASKSKLDYPRFNPLTIFSASKDNEFHSGSNDLIYGANVESEVTIRGKEFPLDNAVYEQHAELSAAEVEDIVRKIAPSLEDGAISVSAIPYFDATRFTLAGQVGAISTFPGITITAENVSEFSPADPEKPLGRNFYETVVTIRQEQPIQLALSTVADDEAANKVISEALASPLSSTNIKTGYKLRVALETSTEAESAKIRRVSVYFRGNHISSVARRDDGQFVFAPAPAPVPAIADTEDKNGYSVVSRKQLPSIYNGIYRAALSQKLTKPLARQLIKIFAFDVDFQTRISPSDTLDVFYSLDADTRKISEASEILYTSIRLNGVTRKYYRFRTPDDGVVDYYDEFGKSAKKFLLRKPVPYGRFRSAFGMRRHPVTRYRKMHTGVDWSAKRGTKILAAGNGIVEKAGWSGGYGKQTIIRHANGYKTSYSHQSQIAKWITPGVRVRQGQVIGAVGSTGLSTGPHLHYEVIVNGNKVNPMKIRLPKGRILKGDTLAKFESERNRIDTLLEKKNDNGTKLI